MQGADLVHAVDVGTGDAQHLQPVFEGLAATSGDDADLVAHFDRVGQRIAVLGVVAADEVAVRGGDDAPVGHHAVHVEDEGFGADYIFFEVSHMLLLMIE